MKVRFKTVYRQIELDEASRKFTTISTSKGLFQYTRLIYGLTADPAIFQKFMDSLLMKIKGVVVFLDDILITAPARKSHLQTLENVFSVLPNTYIIRIIFLQSALLA